MKIRNLFMLFVVAVVMVLIAKSTRNRNVNTASELLGSKVFPDLQVNDIEKVEISAPDGTSTLVKADEKWVVREKYDYPADFDKLRKAIMSLSDLKIGQVVDMTDKQKSSMNLTSKSGIMVKLYEAADKKLGSLLIGKERLRKTTTGPGYPDGRFISTDGGGSKIYLVSDNLRDVTAGSDTWTSKDLLSVDPPNVQSITISGADTNDLILKADDKGDLELDGLKDDEDLDPSKLYSVKSAMSYMRLKDVADPLLSEKDMGFDSPVTFKTFTKKGEIYTALVGKKLADKDSYYVRFRAELMPAKADAIDEGKADAKDAVDNNGSADKKDDAKKMVEAAKKKKAEERQKLEDKVNKLQEKLVKWTYILDGYKVNYMKTKRQDIVKAKEKKKDADNKDDKAK